MRAYHVFHQMCFMRAHNNVSALSHLQDFEDTTLPTKDLVSLEEDYISERGNTSPAVNDSISRM